jgi:hypothetical protein
MALSDLRGRMYAPTTLPVQPTEVRSSATQQNSSTRCETHHYIALDVPVTDLYM